MLAIVNRSCLRRHRRGGVISNGNNGGGGGTSNDNRTEWSPIWSVIITLITESDNRAEGVRFAVYHEYDYRPN